MENNTDITQFDNQWQVIAYLTDKIENNNTNQSLNKQIDKELKEAIQDQNQLIKNVLDQTLKDIVQDQQDIREDIQQLNEEIKQLKQEDRQPTKTVETNESRQQPHESFKCTLCGREIDSRRGLAGHLIRAHDKTGKGVTEEFGQTIQEQQKEQETQVKEKFECPTCGKDFDSVNSLSNHLIGQSDHKNPSEHYNVDGNHVCPKCSEKFDTQKQLSTHLSKMHDSSPVREIAKQSKVQQQQQDMYDDQGNIKAFEDRSKNIKDLEQEYLEKLVYNYLDDKQVAKTQESIAQDLFGQKPETGSKPYNKLYKALKRNDNINMDKSMGRSNRYYTDKAMVEQAKHEHIVEKIEQEIGENRWKLFVRAMKTLLPEKGEDKKITFYDFSSEYIGDEEISSDKMWKLFASPEKELLRNGLKQLVDGELSFKWSSKSFDKNIDSFKQWEIIISHR